MASDTASFVLGQLLAHGHVRRAWLGLSGQTVRLPRRLARAAGLVAASGVRVTEVVAGGPAALGGVIAGDTLLALGEVALSGVDDLVRTLTGERIGRPVMLRLLRGASLSQIGLRPTERP